MALPDPRPRFDPSPIDPPPFDTRSSNDPSPAPSRLARPEPLLPLTERVRAAAAERGRRAVHLATARAAAFDPTRLAVACSALAIVVSVAAVGLTRRSSPSRPAAPVESALPFASAATNRSPALIVSTTSPTTGVAPSTAAALLTVHVAGAVTHPGLYRLAAAARVADAVAAAGGLAAQADLDRINLAAAVHDAERVWLPRRGQAPPSVVAGADAGAGGAGGPSTDVASATKRTDAASGPLDLNSANAALLDTLPGVGPATAAAIVEYRTRKGPFRSVAQLLEVPGIGDAKLAALRARVRV